MAEYGPFGTPFLTPKNPPKKLMWPKNPPKKFMWVPFLRPFPGNEAHQLFWGGPIWGVSGGGRKIYVEKVYVLYLRHACCTVRNWVSDAALGDPALVAPNPMFSFMSLHPLTPLLSMPEPRVGGPSLYTFLMHAAPWCTSCTSLQRRCDCLGVKKFMCLFGPLHILNNDFFRDSFVLGRCWGVFVFERFLHDGPMSFAICRATPYCHANVAQLRSSLSKTRGVASLWRYGVCLFVPEN